MKIHRRGKDCLMTLGDRLCYVSSSWITFVTKCFSDRKRKGLYVTVSAMPLRSPDVSSRDNLNALTQSEERRRTGRYVAGGTALAVMLLALHHLFLRGTSTIAGVCVPTIIMASYLIWVLYSARRDRRKALRFATAMQLTEVISVPSKSTSDAICKDAKSDDNFERNPSNPYKSRNTRENPVFSDKDEV
ncbi:uncharacterized protein LOC105203759 [Solenopsis invicta]|uniref:uncharacterized protein LOC105203759 n=1 Tax=Solenopsis invicta TaxID=13686 RepID=UPI00193D19EA|nr:uncharacterized protein LOC105203759 [Solenopsis invicta]XP_039313040.1 uncharacterized protein LOC105203759 [Solenopsis invicta]XP_039313045.1 uncharacterized protein LOC105203759 [Solenopsis invicta]